MEKTKSKLSPIEIAKTQRHVFLLQKIKENKTLSKVELDELKRYERKGKLTITAGMRRQIKQIGALTSAGHFKESPGKAVKKVSGKAGKKRRDRLPTR